MLDTPAAGNFNLDRQEHDELLDLFFHYLNGFAAFVDEGLFRQGMVDRFSNTGIDTPGYSLFLHLSILAVAARISPRRSARKSRSFVQAALALIDSELAARNPMTVTSFLLLCVPAVECQQTSLSWIFVGKYDVVDTASTLTAGMAVRLAQDIGLHISIQPLVSVGLVSAASQQAREDVFWTLYVQEKFVLTFTVDATRVGAKRSSSADTLQTQLPVLRQEPIAWRERL